MVLHPGSHMGEGVDRGIERIAKALDEVHRRVDSDEARILLETTAGQGTTIGHRAEHLGRIIGLVQSDQRLGVCVDTCHVFAAGYDIRKPAGYGRLVDEIAEHVGLDRVRCFHLNDSLREFASRVDRHEHIGKGKIGNAGFRLVVNDARFADVPKILETHKGVDGRGQDLDKVNLKRLRKMIRD